jgi:predicted lipoprotein with Yx(FWY)xxD motif
MRNRWWAAPLLLAGSAAALAACGTSSPSTSASSPPSSPAATSPSSPATGTNTATGAVTIDERSTSLGEVLTNAQGKTLYWFAIDTPSASKCYGTCASYWAPVIGTPKAGSGVTLSMTFGTIKRTGGATQATYDGHPLYTYVGDTSPGMTSGNGKNLSGGLWWAMTPTGTKPSGSAPSPSSSPTSGSGGYGY